MEKKEKKKNILKILKHSIAVKILLGITLLMILSSVAASWIGYDRFTEVMLLQYADGAFRIAEIADNVVDPDRLDYYREHGPNTDDYKKTLERLDSLCNDTGVTFIYIIQPDTTDYGHIVFLFSLINHESPYARFEFGYVRETTNDDYRNKYRSLYETDSTRELVIRDQGYIQTDPHITAMVPLRGSDGKTKGILCVQRQMDILSTARRDYIHQIVLAQFILLIIAIAIMWIFLNRTVLSPVKRITEEATRFANDNVAADSKLSETIKSRNEIGTLAGSIDQMEEQVENYVDNLTRVTAEKERISTELAVAARIQANMLPSDFPPFPERSEFDIYAVMDPAREVGGDFYDFFLVDDDHLCLIMADVSGKGVPAALFMMSATILIHNNVMEGKSPAKALEDTNTAICAKNREEMFVTVWLGILEISTGRLTAVNAGHEYPIMQVPGKPFELIHDKHGFVLGGLENVRYREYELQFDPGSRLFLYTDGLAEATNTENELFGTDRIIESLNRSKAQTAKQIMEDVNTDVDKFVGEAPQFDDLTMLCLEYYHR